MRFHRYINNSEYEVLLKDAIVKPVGRYNHIYLVKPEDEILAFLDWVDDNSSIRHYKVTLEINELRVEPTTGYYYGDRDPQYEYTVDNYTSDDVVKMEEYNNE